VVSVYGCTGTRTTEIVAIMSVTSTSQAETFWRHDAPGHGSVLTGGRQSVNTRLSAGAITQSSSNMIDAPRNAVFPDGSKGGETSTTSAPTM